MRIAALAFGVVAGLIASLILALGGLDVSATAGFSPDRQIQVTRFGLFVIANLGVFGAGLVLASALGGAILFVIGALAWVAAALLLHHGTDLVIIVPPALLLTAAALAGIAQLRRGGAPLKLPPLRFSRSRREEPGELSGYGDNQPVAVGAGFFGEGGTARPLGNAGEPSLGAVDGPGRGAVDWVPGKRRPAPPRQQPMFRPADDDIEETGFSRIARGVSSVLSFGLYAGLAAAAILVFWNLRSADNPAAAKVEPAPKAVASAAAPVLSSAAPAVSVAEAAPAPATTAPAPRQVLGGVVVADDTPTAFEPPDTNGLDPNGGTPAAPAADSTAAPTDGPAPQGDVVMPYTMSPQMAAERAGGPSPAPRRSATPQQAPLNSTGL